MQRLQCAEKAIMDFVHERTLVKCDPVELYLCAKLRHICTALALIDMSFSRHDSPTLGPLHPDAVERLDKLSHVFIEIGKNR